MDTYTYIILPVLIFLARIVDVSLATLRIIFISKGMRSIIYHFQPIDISTFLNAFHLKRSRS